MIGASLLFVLAAQSPTEPSVVVAVGSADRWVGADAAIVTLTVTGQADQESAAAVDARSSVERVLMALRKAMPDPKAFQVLPASVSPGFPFASGGSYPGAFGGLSEASRPTVPNAHYECRQTVEVEIDDLDRLSNFVKVATGTEAGVSVRFTVHDSSTARRAVLKAAFEDARVKGEESAQAAGFRLGEVYQIETGVGATIIPSPFVGRMAVGHPLEFSKPNVLAHATLTVRFYLLK